ncbi:MAG TPA: hypothetical protein VJ124_01720 [Pyrinomonadaceae bacterium]|nr:hypothetical protein [Pyrinomonadaceae bacterium]
MAKAIIVLCLVVGAISLSIFAFATVGRGPLISKIESPDKTYVLYLTGKKSRPAVPIIEHSVYFDLYRHGKPVVRGRELHSGDWFDPAFENLYGDHSWANNSTLMFHRRKGPERSRDTLNVANNTSKCIKFLRVQSSDLFLLFDLKPQARARLSASPQTWLSWITAEGEFEDAQSISKLGVNFKIDSS